MEQDTIIFREQQRFTQVWLWVVVLGVAAVFWAGLVYQLILKQPFGHNPAADVQLIIMFVVMGIGLPAFFYTMRLQTEVATGELRVRFYPFHLRAVRIPLHLVRDYERTTYNPISEYGGWGIRWGVAGKAYNMSGCEGVKLYFYNHKPLLVGSQKAADLYEAIRQAKEKQNPPVTY